MGSYLFGMRLTFLLPFALAGCASLSPQVTPVSGQEIAVTEAFHEQEFVDRRTGARLTFFGETQNAGRGPEVCLTSRLVGPSSARPSAYRVLKDIEVRAFGRNLRPDMQRFPVAGFGEPPQAVCIPVLRADESLGERPVTFSDRSNEVMGGSVLPIPGAVVVPRGQEEPRWSPVSARFSS